MAYVYRHIRSDKNEPFYIGIGKSSNYYRAYSRDRRNNMWWNIVKKTTYEVEIIFEHDDYEVVKNKEVEFIELYGRRQFKNGTLVNMTKGGDGVVGRLVTDEQRKKISDSRKGEKHPMYGKKLPKSTVDKIRKSNTGAIFTQERKSKISSALIGRTAHNKGLPASEKEKNRLKKMGESISIPVAKYDLGGNLLEVYNSVIQAAKSNNIQQGNITNASNKKIMYGGFIWRYISEGVKEKIEAYLPRTLPIIQTDINGNVIAEYLSAKDAQRKTGYQKSSILRVAKGVYKQAYGFKWAFKIN